jgi:hypothetical protein
MFVAHLGVENDPPAGVSGLQTLCHALREHLSQPQGDDDDERLFVELAGSFLGVVLALALGAGTHEKRDGRHGLRFAGGEFFDPFSAVERVLDAEDVRTCLASEVARAEALARGNRDATWRAVKNHVLPRVVGPRFFARLGAEAEHASVFTLALANELRIALLLRERGRARYVLGDEVARWAVDPTELKRTALDNLARSSAQARLFRCDGDAFAYVVARTGDGLDSSRLLLPGLHDVLAPQLGTPFAAAIPHRDALMACALQSEEALAALRARAATEAAAAAHSITADLFIVEAGGRVRAMSA